MSDAFDAVVLSADAQSLVAAAYLARGGARTLVLGEPVLPLLPLFALDPVVVRELALARAGLQYAVRDMVSVGLRSDGRHMPLARDLHSAARSLRGHAPTDVAQWLRFRRELFRLARSFRKLWWDDERPAALAADIERLSALSAAAWLNAELENDALKALAAFEVASCGMSPHAPGSALALVWRAAQEIGGLQGAKVMPLGGDVRVLTALEKVARQAGAILDRDRKVVRIRTGAGGVEGVELAGGEFVAAPVVVSGYSRHRTLAEFLPRGVAGFETLAQTKPPVFSPLRIGLTLPHMPTLQGEQHPLNAHFILAEKLESFALAEAVLRTGAAPHEPLVSFTVDGNRLSLLVWPGVEGLDMTEAVLAALEPVVPGAKSAIVDYAFVCDGDPVTAQRLVSSPRQRIMTPVAGLYLCAVEPMDVFSGRAARHASSLAAAQLKNRAAA